MRVPYHLWGGSCPTSSSSSRLVWIVRLFPPGALYHVFSYDCPIHSTDGLCRRFFVGKPAKRKIHFLKKPTRYLYMMKDKLMVQWNLSNLNALGEGWNIQWSVLHRCQIKQFWMKYQFISGCLFFCVPVSGQQNILYVYSLLAHNWYPQKWINSFVYTTRNVFISTCIYIYSWAYLLSSAKSKFSMHFRVILSNMSKPVYILLLYSFYQNGFIKEKENSSMF